MTLPTFEIVDEMGDSLPYLSDELDVQYTRLYGRRWFVHVDGRWQGEVALLSDDKIPLPLLPISGQPGFWYLPSEKEAPPKLQARYRQTIGGAGRLKIGLIDEKGRPIPNVPVKYLDIFPGNIAPEHLLQMLNDIGLLALSAKSQVVSRDLVAPLGEGQGLTKPGFGWDTSEGLLTTATAVQELVRVLQQELPRLKSRPLRSITVQVGPTRVDKALNQPSTLPKLYTSHGRRTIIGQTRVETLDCSENQAVLFILHLLEILIPYLKMCLEAELPPISFLSGGIPRKQTPQQKEFFRELGIIQKQRQEQRRNLLERRKGVTAQLTKSLEWVTQERNDSFWRKLSQPAAMPPCSLWLMGSPSYTAIYSLFQKLWGNTRTHLDPVLFLLENTQQGHIHPVWKIYELWCFINLYYALALEIQGLRSIGPDLLEMLTLKKGELHLPGNTPFSLVGKLPDGSALQFTLWYEPRLKASDGNSLTPDILVELRIRSRKMYFVFDCKYRDYQSQGASQLVDDVLGVAKAKYLESGFKFENDQRRLNVKASFIIHTSRKFDYWGEVPLRTFIAEHSEHFGSDAASQSYDVKVKKGLAYPGQYLRQEDFAAHRYGAIFLRTGYSEKPPLHQFRRLVYLMLYYFAHEVGYCPHCGVSAKFPEDPHGVQGKGTYLSCPNCGRFWIDHFCGGIEHHPIIKLGTDGFHRSANNSNGWVCVCPSCGNSIADSAHPVCGRMLNPY